MADQIETQVLIMGGGPVGLTLGMDLAQRGVRTVGAQMRHKGEPPSVKCKPSP
jgi:flavin-dependent dehydrogenase